MKPEPRSGMGQTPRVAEELRQNRPFRSPAQEAIVGVMLTGDRILGLLGAELGREADITPQQYNVLRILRGAGSEGLPTLAITERMIERTPGITRLLDRLERKGWIERQRLEEDRRQVICRATKAGLKLLSRLDRIVDAVDDRPKRALSSRELEQLVELLDRLRSTLN